MNGHSQKKGVLVAGPTLKKGGGLTCGLGNKGVFTAAHTCTGHIYISPPHNMKSGTTKKYGTWTLYSRTSLAICGKQICFETQNDISSKYYPGISGNIY